MPIEVRPGGELAQEDVSGLDSASLDLIAHGPPGARWLLLEAPLFSAPIEGLHAAADELRGHGFGILLAHPERCPALFADGRAPLRRELEREARLLLNATSLTGLHGKEPRRLGLDLVREGLATAIASDAHRISRGPALSTGLDAALRAGVDPESAHALVDTAPAALLARGLSI